MNLNDDISKNQGNIANPNTSKSKSVDTGLFADNSAAPSGTKVFDTVKTEKTLHQPLNCTNNVQKPTSNVIPPVYSTGTATPVPNPNGVKPVQGTMNSGNTSAGVVKNPASGRSNTQGNVNAVPYPNPDSVRGIHGVPNSSNSVPNAQQSPPKVMPRVQNPSGTAVNANANATRIMPVVPPYANNGVSKPRQNLTKVMPRVQNPARLQNTNQNATKIPQTPAAPTGNSQNPSNNIGNISYGAYRTGNDGNSQNSQTHGTSSSFQHNNGTINKSSTVKNPPQNTASKKSAVNTKKKRKKNNKGNFFIGVSKFVLYIAFIVIASVLISKYIIGAGNDVFAFVKDSYNYTDTVYSTKGDAKNSFRVKGTSLSGDKFEFSYSFGSELTLGEKEGLDASLLLVDLKNNSVVHNFGKYTSQILKGENIKIDLANADMLDSDYILRLTVGTGNNVFYITEFYFSRISVDITLENDASTADVAKILKENNLIDYPSAFKIYAKLKKNDESSLGTTYISGAHKLYAGMDYDEILYALSPKKNVRSIVKITFPEGSTVDDIIDKLIKGGVKNSKQDYIKAMQDLSIYDYRFINLLEEEKPNSERVYPLEGYLFPDTYEFYTDATPETVINKFLANFDKKFDNSFYDEAAKQGLSVDEVVRIASLVESEAGNPDDKGNISSVFHNRLNTSDVYPRLESDATTDYASFNLKSNLKFSNYKCSKCGKKDTKSLQKCSECGNSASYKEYKCASFSIKLTNYDLIDADYYINFTVSSDTTRAKSVIFFEKSSKDGNDVYKITSKNSETKPEMGDITSSISNATIDKNGVLTCEFMLDHNFNDETFAKFSSRLNLYRSAYDTYNIKGLMPSAVSNPGYESLIAALYPNNTNYYFFVADKSGNSHFSSTKEAHDAMIYRLQSEGRAVSAN